MFVKIYSLMRWTFAIVFLFGFFTNLVQLGLPLYTMQVFDRVIPSGHLPTLIALTLLLGFITLCSLFIESSRGLLLASCSRRFGEAFDSSVAVYSLVELKDGVSLADVDKVRAFITGPAITAFLDLPWTVIYLMALFTIHIAIGLYVLVCFGVLLALASLGRYILAARETTFKRTYTNFNNSLASITTQPATLSAMGLLPGMLNTLIMARVDALGAQQILTNRVVWSDSLSRTVRSLMQLGILALATVLVVDQKVNAGAIVASSMIFTKAIAPIERLNSSYSVLQSTLRSWRRIVAADRPIATLPKKVTMPAINGHLTLSDVTLYPSKSHKPVIDRLTLDIKPGGVHIIVGVAGAGKSSLARLMCGAQRPTRGSITLDGMALERYDVTQLSREVGYLPQRTATRAMPVLQFISRGEAGGEQHVFEAASLTGADSIIRLLPDGYQTILSADSETVSAGEYRRIALASAIYKAPPLLILDEPMLDMDDLGEHDVVELIRHLKTKSTTLIIVSKSPKLLHLADEIIYLDRGRVAAITDPRSIRDRWIHAASQSAGE